MKIRSRVLAVRVALVASAIIAVPGLDLAGLDLIRPAQAAGKKPSVALGPIEGKKSKEVRGWVLDSMEKNYEVTDADEVVPKAGGDAAYAKAGKALGTEWVVTGKVDALSGLKQALIGLADKLPGSRMLDGRFMAVQQSIGVPKGRDAGLQYLRGFVEEAKSSGLVARAIERTGARGVSVAPKAL